MPDNRRFQPGGRSAYGGTIVDRGTTDPVRIIPTKCGRCHGMQRVGDELFCPICQPDYQNYEPYFAEDDTTIRHQLVNRGTFAERQRQHPAHPRTQKSSGVTTRSAGRRRR